MNQSSASERGIVIFDSKLGNTEKIAKSLASGLEMTGVPVTCVNARDVQIDALGEYDFIAVGAPTQALTASRAMKDFLQKLQETQTLKGKYGFAFDTKFRYPLAGSGARFIEKRLTKLGMKILMHRQSATVKKTEGPLEEGEEQAFERIGFEIGTTLAREAKIVSNIPAKQ